MNWYYALNGQQQGPVPESEIASLAAAGTLKPDTLIWSEGLADWQPLSQALPAALSSTPINAPQLGGVAVPEARKDLYVQQMREGVTFRMGSQAQYAGFWIRVAAKLVDSFILSFILMVVMGLLAGGLHLSGMQIAPDQTPGSPPPTGFIILIIAYYVLAIGLQIFYSIYLTGKYGATWGKMAVGIRVVGEDGSRVSYARSTGRFFAEWLSGMTMGIGYIIAAFDSEKRSLHDHVCATRVIYK